MATRSLPESGTLLGVLYNDIDRRCHTQGFAIDVVLKGSGVA